MNRLSCLLKNLCKIISMFLTMILLLSLGAAANASQNLEVRVSPHQPYVYFDENLKSWEGLSIDILRALAKKVDCNINFRHLPRQRAFELIKAGDLDIMINLTQTTKREEFLDFIGLSSYEQMGLVVKKEDVDVPISSLDDLIKLDKIISVRKSYVYPQLSERLKTDQRLQRQIDTLDVSIHSSMAILLQRGVHFGFFEDRGTLAYRINHHPNYANLALHPYTLNEPQIVHFAVSKKTPVDLRNKLRNAHAALVKDGTIENILSKWDRLLAL